MNVSDINILYVDDDELNLELLREILIASNFNVYTTSNGYECLKYIHENSVDILICDYKMPDINGLEIIEQAKKIKPTIKCILLSGFIENELLLYKNIVDAFMNKPWKKSELLKVIQILIESSGE